LKPKFDFIEKKLKQLKNDNLLRKLRKTSVDKGHIIISQKKYLNLSSNDYLGINLGTINYSQMQSSSRLISGNDSNFEKLEKLLSKHKSHEKSIVYPTGYMANLGAIPSIVEKNDFVFSDELNHVSIIEACKLSGAKIKIYKHNDVEDLEKKLNKTNGRKFIITEGIFSMDGDISSLKEITNISANNDSILILDDAHGDFVFGRNGRGTGDMLGVNKKIDVYISSLSKGLGSFGGYISSQKSVIDLCINQSRSFIYTSALPSSIVNFSIKRLNMNREKRRRKLWKNVKAFHKGLENIGFVTKSSSQIIPIMIGSEKKAMDFGKFLLSKNIFAHPIRFPTVKKDNARIRISITAWHTKKEIDYVLEILEKAGRRFQII
tara:strand:- start:110 stop:1240 length:1131 start_codon:yes stop_codon:yes gene_type:complete